MNLPRPEDELLEEGEPKVVSGLVCTVDIYFILHKAGDIYPFNT